MVKIENGTEMDERLAETDIQKFYAEKTIFITGSTGFVGMCLVEKLLRSCPRIKRIYVLVREKKGMSAEKRIKMYFDDALFDRLRQENTDFSTKIRLVNGDLTKDDMALSEKDKNSIIDEVNLIFHVASVVKFDERLSIALRINVLGTNMMIDLAKKCKCLEGFTYVSTAYSHCYERNIMEKMYLPPADMKMVQELIAADSATAKGLSGADLADVIGEHPNTYTFTKGIAEGFIDEMSKEVSFPCIVYRPSIVLSSWKEPVRSWCGNAIGAAAFALAYGLGILHTAMPSFNIIDIIPVDISANSIVVSMWDAVSNRPKVSSAHVYNCGTSVEKPITIRAFKEMCLGPNNRITVPSIHTVWTNFVIFTESYWCFSILHVLLHFLPALIIDASSFVTGKKRRALSTFVKLQKAFLVMGYFTRNEWKIDVSRLKEAIDRMSLADRQLFFCDVRKLDWKDYCSTYWAGLRSYILKEPISTLPAARRKVRIIKTVHITIKYTMMLLVAYSAIRKFQSFAERLRNY